MHPNKILNTFNTLLGIKLGIKKTRYFPKYPVNSSILKNTTLKKKVLKFPLLPNNESLIIVLIYTFVNIVVILIEYINNTQLIINSHLNKDFIQI